MADPFGRQTFREPKSHFGSNHGLSRGFRIFLHRLLFSHHIIERTLGYNRVIPLMIFAIVACLVGRNDKLRVLGVFVRHALVHITVILILLLLFALIFIDLSVTAYDRLQTGTSLLHIQCILVNLNLLRMEQLLIALILLLAGFEQVHCDRLHSVIMLIQVILMSLQQSACIDSSNIAIVQLVKPRLR